MGGDDFLGNSPPRGEDFQGGGGFPFTPGWSALAPLRTLSSCDQCVAGTRSVVSVDSWSHLLKGICRYFLSLYPSINQRWTRSVGSVTSLGEENFPMKTV